MRSFGAGATFVVALLVFSRIPTAQNAPAADVVGVGNFSRIVANMDRAVAFYRDVLGLQVTTDVPFSPNPAASTVLFDDLKI